MTFSEMAARTAELLEKDLTDTDFANAVKHALNVAYMTVARDKFRPVTTETMTVIKGRIPISLFSEAFLALKSVHARGGIRVSAWAGHNFIYVTDGFGEVAVTYYYLPAPMAEDDDEPMFTPAQVDPYAFIYFAAATYLNIKHKHADAAVWDERYRGIVENIREERTSFILPTERWR